MYDVSDEYFPAEGKVWKNEDGSVESDVPQPESMLTEHANGDVLEDIERYFGMHYDPGREGVFIVDIDGSYRFIENRSRFEED